MEVSKECCLALIEIFCFSCLIVEAYLFKKALKKIQPALNLQSSSFVGIKFELV